MSQICLVFSDLQELAIAIAKWLAYGYIKITLRSYYVYD